VPAAIRLNTSTALNNSERDIIKIALETAKFDGGMRSVSMERDSDL